MKTISTTNRRILGAVALGWLVVWIGAADTRAAPGGAGTNEIRIVELQGKVEIIRAGSTVGVPTTETNQVLYPSDRLRVGPKSRVALRWSEQSIVTFGPLTEVEIQPPHARGAQSGLRLLQGLLSFFHRDEPGRIRVITRGATAGVEGTEFVAQVETVNGTERTTFSVLDGQVNFGNDHGTLVLTNGQQGTVELGHAPVRTTGFIANSVLQWCFYYPAILDLRDLPLAPEQEQILHDSLDAYRAGDLLAALDKYPAGRQPTSDAERIYHAALLLAVGQVSETEAALAGLRGAEPADRLPRLANALRQLIAAVKRETNPSPLNSAFRQGQAQAGQRSTNQQLATEFLAASYYEQSRATGEDSLTRALDLAKRAVTNSPEFGFGWERVAELEFSFGRPGRALDALNKSLALAPRNAQALALHGFLLAAQNKTQEARERFDQAIAADPALGNAWLGRGLSRIRRGDAKGGREDLLVAAALEPQRALLRSYLGKAYASAGDRKRARHELDLAKKLDPADPTAWLYSALLDEQENRVKESIREKQKSNV
jgi:tetratricopeptide (TPR) repeat protein